MTSNLKSIFTILGYRQQEKLHKTAILYLAKIINRWTLAAHNAKVWKMFTVAPSGHKFKKINFFLKDTSCLNGLLNGLLWTFEVLSGLFWSFVYLDTPHSPWNENVKWTNSSFRCCLFNASSHQYFSQYFYEQGHSGKVMRHLVSNFCSVYASIANGIHKVR